jgi:cyclic AMP-dependent transcription factor ATF-4
MESLQLPFDIQWEGKTEPLSPSHLSSTYFEEEPLFEDNFAENFIIDDTILLNSKLHIEKLQEILQLSEALDEDDIIIKQDQWLDDRIDITPFTEEYSTEPIGFYPVKQTNTTELLREFESVYDAVEYTHLTPPQTPPEHKKLSAFDQFALVYPVTTDVQTHCHNNTVSTAKLALKQQQNASNDGYALFIPDEIDFAQELELVEELVRTRAKDLPDWNNDDDDDDSFGCGSSSSSSCLSPRSDTSYSGESKNSHEDDEWYPETTNVKSSSLTKRKSKTRTSEDRKSRKKEQNKNAATRYRQKKKQEVEEILGEERALRNTNKDLHANYTDLKREIKYLKSLMRELYKAKGLLKN